MDTPAAHPTVPNPCGKRPAAQPVNAEKGGITFFGSEDPPQSLGFLPSGATMGRDLNEDICFWQIEGCVTDLQKKSSYEFGSNKWSIQNPSSSMTTEKCSSTGGPLHAKTATAHKDPPAGQFCSLGSQPTEALSRKHEELALCAYFVSHNHQTRKYSCLLDSSSIFT